MSNNYPDFLSSEIQGQTAENSRFHIIPVPYEKSVSFGEGTINGPKEILKASLQLETYDGFSTPCTEGIFTAKPVDCSLNPEKVISNIKDAVNKSLEYKRGKIPIILGGEHTVSNGAIQALHESNSDFGIVQFDAHADLRDEYEGSKWSHACVMKRALDLGIPMFQIGVRAISKDEVKVRKDNSDLISYIDAYTIASTGIPNENILPENFPKNIYISFDVDGLDPSIMPATGTPVPGGLTWYQSLELLKRVAAEKNVIGADFVELAPIENFHAWDFTIAQLIYNFMGIVQRA